MIDVSIIIACYNGESLLEARVHEFERFLREGTRSWEILLCDDGSTDGTAGLCQKLAQDAANRRYLPQAVHRGRGHTVRAAIPEARGRFVGYVDADASTSAAYLHPVLLALESGYEAAEASRRYHLTPSNFFFIAHRYIAHKVYKKLVSLILGLTAHDTETGFKFFKTEALLKIRDLSHHAGWFWDTEMIANAHRLGYRVAEIPSLFIRKPGMHSTLRLIPDSLHQLSSLVNYARRVGRLRCNLESEPPF